MAKSTLGKTNDWCTLPTGRHIFLAPKQATPVHDGWSQYLDMEDASFFARSEHPGDSQVRLAFSVVCLFRGICSGDTAFLACLFHVLINVQVVVPL